MDDIETLKSRVDIVSLVAERLPLKKSGRNFKANCPFHQEKTPSFMVNPELQIFKCFGCGAGGDAIKFLQLYERMEFWEAVEYLAERTGVKLHKFTPNKDEQLQRRLYDLHRQLADFYHFIFLKHPLAGKARAYARQRGLTLKAIETFKIGFSPLNPANAVEFLAKKGFSPAEMLQSGIVVSSQYQKGKLLDRFHGRLVFPLYDHRGNIIGFSGRLVPGLLPNEDQLGKYINSPETPIYHKSRHLFGLWIAKEAIKNKNQAIIVEGELDVISPWQIGIDEAVAIKGTALTEEQTRLLKRFCQTIILALDKDAAGSAAALRGVQIAENEGLEVRVLQLGQGIKDPDEAAQRQPDLLRQAVQKTIPVWDFVISAVVKKYRPAGKAIGIAEKKRILAEVLPFLTQISNEVEKDYYLKKLSRRLKVGHEAILLEAEKVTQKSLARSFIPASTGEETRPDRREILEKYLLSLIFTSDKPEKMIRKIKLSFFETHRWRRIFKLARQFVRENKFSAADFLSFLPQELQEGFTEMFFKEEDEVAGKREIERVINELRKLACRTKMEHLAAEMALAEKGKKEDKLALLEKKFALLSAKIVELDRNE